MNFKRITAAMLSMTMVCGAATVTADQTAYDAGTAYAADEKPLGEFTEGMFNCEEYSDHIRIRCFNDPEGDMIIPEEINGLPVTELGTFESHSYVTGSGDLSLITSVVIPDSVKKIGNHVFGRCTSLESVTLGKNVEYIGEMAFYDAPISEIKLPDGLKTIDDSAFGGCEKLVSIDIPDSVTKIGDSVFINCNALTSVEIPDSVTETGESVFYGCKSLKEAEINGTSVSPYMFSHCSALETVVIGDNAKSIGEHSFEGCKVLKNISIGKNVEKIDNFAIYLCPELTEIVLPESLKTLGGFMGCDNLLNITILSRDCEIKYIGGSTMMMVPATPIGEPSAEPIHAVTLYGYRNSTTQEYAENNKYRFVPLDPEPETTGTTDVSATTAIAGTGSADTDTTPVIPAVTAPPETGTAPAGTAKTIPSPLTVAPQTAATVTRSTAAASAAETGKANTAAAVPATALTGKPSPTAVAVQVTTTAAPVTSAGKPVASTTEKATVALTATTASTAAPATAAVKPVTTDAVITTAEPSTEAAPVTTEPVIDTPDQPEPGDVNDDGVVDSSDASEVLLVYAQISTGRNEVSGALKKAADLNGDGLVDSSDASLILEYYAYVSTGGTDTVTEYLDKKNDTK